MLNKAQIINRGAIKIFNYKRLETKRIPKPRAHPAGLKLLSFGHVSTEVYIYYLKAIVLSVMGLVPARLYPSSALSGFPSQSAVS